MARVKKPDVLIGFFSPETRRYYRLIKTSTWPALEISGFRMHPMQDTDPKKSTEEMVSALGSAHGKVLDTCAGLGYTAIALAQKPAVKEVVTFEIDRNVLEIAKRNPQSEMLFSGPKIKLHSGDVSAGLCGLPENYFDAILHDPPTIKITGELYRVEFYKKLFKALKPGGILFHYTGSPGEKRGKDFQAGVMRRLREAGFSELERVPGAQGVRAIKK